METKYLEAALNDVAELKKRGFDFAELFEGTWKWGLGGVKGEKDGKKIWEIEPTVCSDGPVGVRKENDEGQTIPSVLYPSPAAMASTWDLNLEGDMGKAIAYECKKSGVDVLLAPGVNIKRNPLCGRNFEYLSEDPYLAGKIASAFIAGLQSQGVGACVKHYICNSQETERFHIDACVDEKTLMDIYFPAFAIVCTEADPWCVMASYNKVNGIQSCENPFTISLLRDYLGWQGVIMSDWGGVDDSYQALMSGLNIQMPGTGGSIVKALEERDDIDQKDVRTVAEESAKYIFALNERSKDGRKIVSSLKPEQCQKISLKAARESIILLKNEENLLPLRKGGKYLVVGKRAVSFLNQGNGSSHIIELPNSLSDDGKYTQPLDALRKTFSDIEYVQGYDYGRQTGDLEKVLSAANGKDAVIMFLGVSDWYDAEGVDKLNLNLPQDQIDLYRALKEKGHKVILVVESGSALDLSAFSDCEAILWQYVSGSYGGQAIADILTGESVPCGKLAETLPVSSENPLLSRRMPLKRDDYEDKGYVGYRLYDSFGKRVCYPFGHGLSYTSFRYSDLKVSTHELTENGNPEITFTISNTGSRTGKEIAQIYLRPANRLKGIPLRRLVGFAKVELNPGESTVVRIKLTPKGFATWNTENKDYMPMSGSFVVEVGASSRDIRLTDRIDVPCAPWTQNIRREDELTHPWSDESFRREDSAWPDDHKAFDRNSSLKDVFNSKWYLRFAFNVIKKKFTASMMADSVEVEDARRLNDSFFDSPLRICYTMGFSHEFVDGMVDLANGHFFAGIGKLLTAPKSKQEEASRDARERSRFQEIREESLKSNK